MHSSRCNAARHVFPLSIAVSTGRPRKMGESDMPSVTVLGVSHETITLNYDSAANAHIASVIAAAISNGIETGSIIPVDGGFGPLQIPPPLPGGKTGEFVQTNDGVSIL